MSFLAKVDYEILIEEDKLDQLLTEQEDTVEEDLLDEVQQAATEEMASYLRHKFDEAKIFITINDWDITVLYSIGTIVRLDAPAWVLGTSYVLNDIVSFERGVFKNILATSTEDPDNVLNWTLVEKQGGIFTALTAESGNFPDDAAKWTKGDVRQQQIKMFLIDITLYHLHSRLKPRNIPSHRVVRYDGASPTQSGGAIGWLKRVSKDELNPNLPLLAGDDGSQDRIQFNSRAKLTHNPYGEAFGDPENPVNP